MQRLPHRRGRTVECKITARISVQTAHGIRRVIAFVLLCIGVQITWNGVEAMLTTC